MYFISHKISDFITDTSTQQSHLLLGFFSDFISAGIRSEMALVF